MEIIKGGIGKELADLCSKGEAILARIAEEHGISRTYGSEVKNDPEKVKAARRQAHIELGPIQKEMQRLRGELPIETGAIKGIV